MRPARLNNAEIIELIEAASVSQHLQESKWKGFGLIIMGWMFILFIGVVLVLTTLEIPSLKWIGTAIAGFLAWPIISATIIPGNKIIKKPALEVLKKNKQGFVLYLRDFETDDPEKFRVDNFNSLESIISSAVKVHGEILGLGRERVAYGGYRFFIKESDWKEVVTQLINSAAFIVIRFSLKEHVQWEFEVCRQLADPRKVLICIAEPNPVMRQQLLCTIDSQPGDKYRHSRGHLHFISFDAGWTPKNAYRKRWSFFHSVKTGLRRTVYAALPGVPPNAPESKTAFDRITPLINWWWLVSFFAIVPMDTLQFLPIWVTSEDLEIIFIFLTFGLIVFSFLVVPYIALLRLVHFQEIQSLLGAPDRSIQRELFPMYVVQGLFLLTYLFHLDLTYQQHILFQWYYAALVVCVLFYFSWKVVYYQKKINRFLRTQSAG